MQAEAFNDESTFSKTYGLDRLETVSLYLTDNLPEKEKAAIEEAKSRGYASGGGFSAGTNPTPGIRQARYAFRTPNWAGSR